MLFFKRDGICWANLSRLKEEIKMQASFDSNAHKTKQLYPMQLMIIENADIRIN